MKKFILKLKYIISMVLALTMCLSCLASSSAVWQTITVSKDFVSINLDGKPLQIDSFVHNGTTYVPLRAYSNSLGLHVSYDAMTSTVNVVDKEVASLMDKAVAFVVNGSIAVRVNYFTQMLNWYKLNSGITETLPADQWAEFKDFVKDETIKMKITEQLADEMRLSLSYEQREAIDDRISIFAENYGGLEEFIKVLSAYGVTYDFYYSLQENAILKEMVSDILVKPVTEEEVRQYYEDNKNAYKTEKVTAKHILVKTTDDLGYPLSPAMKEAQKKKIDTIYQTIKAGITSFDNAMFENSEDTGLAFYPDGYTFSRGEMNPIFEKEAFSLKPNEMSKVFETEIGYHIVLVTNRSTFVEDFEKVKTGIYNSLRNSRYYQTIEPQISGAYIIINELVYNNL